MKITKRKNLFYTVGNSMWTGKKLIRFQKEN